MDMSEAISLIGKRVKYLRLSDIDTSGRGYCFERKGTVEGASGRNILIGADWMLLDSIVEISECQ